MRPLTRTLGHRIAWLIPALVLLGSASAGEPSPLVGHPQADPKATVVTGHARFTVLTSRLLRLEWSADGRFEDRASLVFINRALPVPPYTVTREGAATVIHTDALTLRYVPEPVDGRFTAENLEIHFHLNGIAPPGVPAWRIPGT